MRLTIAYSKIKKKKRSLVLINNATLKRETLGVRAFFTRLFGFATFTATLKLVSRVGSEQQKVREHGSGALRKWQAKLRKWCKLGKEKIEENKERKNKTNGKWGKKMKGKRIGRGKEKERRRGQDIVKKL